MKAMLASAALAVLLVSAARSQAHAAPTMPCSYFDPQKSDLPPEGMGLAKMHATEIVGAGVTTVTVTGHADMVEARMDGERKLAGENHAVALSRARAEAVRGALYAAGVPRTVTFTIVASGTSAPLAPEQLTQGQLARLASADEWDRDGLDGEVQNRAACLAY